MRTSFVNPPAARDERFIREGRCMQSVDSWAAVWPPLTLAIMAAIARERGEVDLFDCNVEDDYDLPKTLGRVEAFKPDVVVVNTSFPSIDHDAACAAGIKEACPHALVVGFGVFFTLLDEKAMEYGPAFDVGITGEPEVTFTELLDAIRAGRPAANMPGLMWREEGEIRVGPSRPFLENLDALPFAARDMLRNERYRLPTNGHPFTLINVARGCPYPCIFCIAPAYHGKRLRRHSVEYVLEELERCQQELGLYDFLFWEEIFTLDKEFALALCEAICRKGWKISWATTTRVDILDEEILSAMTKAGCALLGLGIETCDTRIFELARKGQSVQDIRRAVKMCKRAGVKTMGHFIFGLPGETSQTAQATIDFALKLGLDYLQCYAAVPYPKTKLGEMAERNGWLTSTNWADYDFGGRCILDIGTIAPEEVDRARNRLFRRFYLRPLYMLKQAGAMLTRPRQWIQASQFLRWMKRRK